MTQILTGYNPKLSDWLKSKPMPDSWSTEVVGIESAQDLATGTVLGKVTATGLYKKCNTAASDGSQTPRGILRDAVNATGVAASGSTGTGNTQVDYVANEVGTTGNDINIVLVDPAANNASLTIAVTGDAQTGYTITISLATGGAGAVTTTSGDIPTLIAGDATAAALVTATDAGNDTDILAAASVTLSGGVSYALTNKAAMFAKLTGMVIYFDKLAYTGTAATVQTALEGLGATMAEETD